MPIITNISQLDPNKTYTYADYLTWRLDKPVELIRGKVRPMSPAPRVRHQAVSFSLSGLIGTMLKGSESAAAGLVSPVSWLIGTMLKGSSCQGFAAPFDVRLLKSTPDGDTRVSTVVQPDLCVICDAAKLDEFGCVGAPDWIIEILSPGNVAHDSKTKFDLYEENGVGEYWMVDPGLKNVVVYVLENDQYQLRGAFYQPSPIPVATLPGATLEWSEVFEGI